MQKWIAHKSTRNAKNKRTEAQLQKAKASSKLSYSEIDILN
jgi:hypothetical protein